MTRRTDTDRKLPAGRRRRQPVDTVRSALRRMGGEFCTVYLDLQTFESNGPGSRQLEVTWSARVIVRETERESDVLADVSASERTPDRLVASIRDELARHLTRRAADRRDRRMPPIVHTTATLRRIG